MKKLLILLMVCSLTIGMDFSLLHGESVPGPKKTLQVSAKVPVTSPEITLILLKYRGEQAPWDGVELDSNLMNFEQLENRFPEDAPENVRGKGAGLWFSLFGHCVVIFAEGYGKQYEITSTCSGLVSGGNELRRGGFGLVPVYSPADEWHYPDGRKVPQGEMPEGAELGPDGPAIGADKLIYRSEPPTSTEGATPRIIQAHYGIAPYKSDGSAPWRGFEEGTAPNIIAGVPLSQAAGTYTGRVILTISAI